MTPCPYCQRTAKNCCGRLECRAVAHWTPEEWADCARLAQATLAAGRQIVVTGSDFSERVDRFGVRVRSFGVGPVTLTELQEEAIRRATR